MSNEVSWLSILSAVAGPAVVVAIYARQSRRNSTAITQALLRAQQERPKYVEQRPRHWYHLLTVLAVLALPFAQWLLYLEHRTRLAFLLPLAAVAGILLVVGMFRPRFVIAQPVNHRETGLRGAILITGLVIALTLPSTGTIVVSRGVLTDVLALFIVAYVTRVWVWNSSNAKPEVQC